MVKGKWKVVFAALLFSLGIFASSYGAETARVEQVQGNMPDVDVYFYPSGETEDEIGEIGALLNHKKLTLEQVVPVSESGQGTHYYFLVDCSTSTRDNQMQVVKKTLLGFLDTVKPKDTVSLITFGLQVEVVLDRETNGEAQRAAIEALRADQKGTLFFDAIAKTVELTDRKELAGERKLAFLFSDSIDVNLGGYTSEEISRMLSDSSIPFYGLGFDTGKKEGLDGLGAVARQSGGQISIVSADGLEESFFKMYEETQAAWVASFVAADNRVGPERQTLSLIIEKGEESTEINRQVLLRHWMPDQTIPAAVGIKQMDEKSLEITFSEVVAGAGDISGYEITGGNGSPVAILSASYDQERNVVWLSLAEALPETTITVKFKGITDVSMEENPVSGCLELPIKPKDKPEEAEPEGEQTNGSSQNMAAWYVLTIGTVAVVTAVAISSVKRKTQSSREPDTDGVYDIKEQEGMIIPLAGQTGPKVHFKEVPASEIRLQVIFQNGESQMLVLPIRGSLFVGRSEICEICLEDRDLSRQHFVIEEQNGCFSIANLSETNGTRVNGIQLHNPRVLQKGDVIEAGQERFTFLGGGGER